MAVNDLFLSILKSENESAVIPFLRNLTKENKAPFSTYLKEIHKEYLEYRMVNNTYQRKATEKQVSILSKASFVCLTSREFMATTSFWSAKFEETDQLLEWYKPKWFENFINRADFLAFRRDSYEWVLRLEERGHLKPTRELIVRVLPVAPIEHKGPNQYEINYQLLLKSSITLSEHIWYLFEQESNFHDKPWSDIILHLARENKIDRVRVLKATLLALTLNFNKNSAGWFVDLFEKLEPTDDDILSLQTELISALNSKHSKAVGMALSNSRRLIGNPAFNVDSVLDSLPILLSSETKTVVTNAISFCERVLKNDPGRSDKLTIALCDAFIVADDTIQTRVSKLIVKFAPADVSELKEVINRYNGSILFGAKRILGKLIDEQSPVAVAQPFANEPEGQLLYEEIKLPANFDELLFLASQAFDGNSIHDIHVLPAALLKLDDQITSANVDKFAPAFQRALQLNFAVYSTNTGFLDHLLSAFFLDYCLHIIEKFPGAAGPLAMQWSKHKDSTAAFAKQFRSATNRIHHLASWKTGLSSNELFQPFKALLLQAFDKIKMGDKLPLLSTPTHEPGYVSPRVLVERLLQYQEANRIPESMDLQVALARSSEKSLEPADDLLLNKLRNDELKKLLEFHLSDKLQSNQKFASKAEWITAAASKPSALFEKVLSETVDVPASYFTGQFRWNIEEVHSKTQKYNLEKRKYEDVDQVSKRLTVHFDKEPTKIKGIFRGLVSRFLTTDKVTLSLYEHFVLTEHDFVTAAVDVERALMLAPCHPEPLLARIIARAFTEKGASQSWQTAIVSKVLHRLTLLRGKFRTTGHLFVALCITTSDKTVQSFAAELWNKDVLSGNLESKQLGEMIGKLLSEGYVPLKRLTDVISANMSNVSAQHNGELQKLLDELIVRIPDEAPVGLKKLLEIYLELISANRSNVPEKVIARLKAWDSSSGLKKVMAAIRELA